MQQQTKQNAIGASIIGFTAGLMVFVLSEVAGSIREVYKITWQQHIEVEDLEKEQLALLKKQERNERVQARNDQMMKQLELSIKEIKVDIVELQRRLAAMWYG